MIAAGLICVALAGGTARLRLHHGIVDVDFCAHPSHVRHDCVRSLRP